MANEQKEKSPEEVKREVALKNLGAANLMNIAAAYLVDSDKGWGENDNNVVEQYKYFPAFSSGVKAYNSEDGEEYDVLQDSILSTRSKGHRYSGNVSELKIMEDCALIMNESLSAVKVSDVMKLMGSKAPVQNDVYLNSLVRKLKPEEAASLTPEQKAAIKASAEVYTKLVGSYQSYLAQGAVMESLAESRKEIPKGLEKLLGVSEKKEPGK